MEGPAHVVYVQGNRAYVGAGPDLEVLDVSDPAHPRLAGRVTLPYTVLDVCVSGSHAIIAAGAQGLYVVDVSNPANPIPVGVYDDLACAYAVAVSGPHVYVAAGPEGLHIVDVSDPTSPAQIGTLPIPGAWTHHVAVAGRPSASAGQAYAYVAGYDYEADQVRWQVVDVSNPAALAMLGAHDLPGWAWGAAVAGDRGYVVDGRRGGLRTLEVTNPAAPAELGFYHTWERRVYDVVVVGNMAYVAAGPEGLRVLDVSNPAAVVEVGYYDTPGDAVGIAVSDGLVYVADGAGGLEVLRVATSPAQPTPIATLVPTPTTTPRTVTISPDEIVARIGRDGSDALPAIWRELGIDNGWGSSAVRVERYDVELDGNPGLEALIKIDYKEDRYRTYLIFTRNDPHWRYLGHIDTYSKYTVPSQHHIVTVDTHGIWLVVQTGKSAGTGLERLDDQWFEVGGAEPKLVLQYPASGHMIGWNPYDVIYEGKIISYDQVANKYVVDMLFTISYRSAWFDDLELFSVTRRARYVWDLTDHRFVPDPARSELSPQEIALIDMNRFWCSDCGPEEFLRRNLEELVHLAIAGKLSEKEWLTQFLSDQMTYVSGAVIEIEDTPEERSLLAILDAMP